MSCSRFPSQRHQHSHASKHYRREWHRTEVDADLAYEWLQERRRWWKEESERRAEEAKINGTFYLPARRIYSNLYRILPNGRWQAETVDTCVDPESGEELMLHWWAPGDPENYVEARPHCSHWKTK